MRRIFWLFLIGTLPTFMWGQKFPDHPELPAINEGPAILANFHIGGGTPAGDLQDRFGNHAKLGISVEYLTENNLFFGLEGSFFFGTEVKEDPLAIIRTDGGEIIGNDRLLAAVGLRKRGLQNQLTLGKLFPIGPKRSGIRLTAGLGYWWHWIRIQDDSRTVAQLTGDYRKGYDRMTAGFSTSQFVGWQHLGNRRRINWTLGFEAIQGYTRGIRAWDFGAMQAMNDARFDMYIGVKAVWTLPFYLKGADKIYY